MIEMLRETIERFDEAAVRWGEEAACAYERGQHPCREVKEEYEEAKLALVALEGSMRTCSKDHLTVAFFGTECSVCQIIFERDAALYQVSNLEFEIAALEEKIRLLEAAQ